MTQSNSNHTRSAGWHRRLSRIWHHRTASPTDSQSPKGSSPAVKPPTGSVTPNPGASAYDPHTGPRSAYARSLSLGLMHTTNMFTRPALLRDSLPSSPVSSPILAQHGEMESDAEEIPTPAPAPAPATDEFADAWAQVQAQHVEMGRLAQELEEQRNQPYCWEPPGLPEETRPKPGPEWWSRPIIPASRLEQLPDEVLMQIMEYLDNGALYRLTQASMRCLRLSFDDVFEADEHWRTFRKTIDGMSGGPRGRGILR